LAKFDENARTLKEIELLNAEGADRNDYHSNKSMENLRNK
jgi:hypothetical protein